MSKTKNELRVAMFKIRNDVTDVKVKNQSIFVKLTQLVEKLNISSVFSYLSMNSEVDTWLFIDYCFKNSIDVCVPYTNNGIMSVKVLPKLPKNHRTDKLGNIDLAAYLADAVVPCDCAVVPLLSFNGQGYRLGYGGGYYDKYLADFCGLKIGLAFEEQYCEDFTAQPFDVPLDIIITQDRAIYRR